MMNSQEQFVLDTVFVEDLIFIEEIEKLVQSTPWSKQNFFDTLQEGHPSFCCKRRGKIVGFIFAMLVLDEIHILNIAVSPDQFRQGIGSAMLNYMHQFALYRDVNVAFLEVNRSNTKARFFYRAHGYEEIGRRKGYYYSLEQGREDAILLRYLLKQ